MDIFAPLRPDKLAEKPWNPNTVWIPDEAEGLCLFRAISLSLSLSLSLYSLSLFSISLSLSIYLFFFFFFFFVNISIVSLAYLYHLIYHVKDLLLCCCYLLFLPTVRYLIMHQYSTYCRLRPGGNSKRVSRKGYSHLWGYDSLPLRPGWWNTWP